MLQSIAKMLEKVIKSKQNINRKTQKVEEKRINGEKDHTQVIYVKTSQFLLLFGFAFWFLVMYTTIIIIMYYISTHMVDGRFQCRNKVEKNTKKKQKNCFHWYVMFV